MDRRTFIASVGGSLVALPLLGEGQQPDKVWRVGILDPGLPDLFAAFRESMRDLGYVERRNIRFEEKKANGNPNLIPALARDLVALKPDVIVTAAVLPTQSLLNETTSIPLVVASIGDAVSAGIVRNLAQPTGNVTGLTQVHDLLAGKSVELLKDVAPQVSRVAILWNPDHADPEFRETQRASRALEVQLQSLEVRQPGEFDGAFLSAERERIEALIVIGSRLMVLNRQRIGDFTAKNRLILIGVPSWLMEIGGLMSYGPDVPELLQRTATYVDKILKGAKQADLPMQQPTTFELTINVKRAKELGLIVPPTVIARADKVIE